MFHDFIYHNINLVLYLVCFFVAVACFCLRNHSALCRVQEHQVQDRHRPPHGADQQGAGRAEAGSRGEKGGREDLDLTGVLIVLSYY